MTYWVETVFPRKEAGESNFEKSWMRQIKNWLTRKPWKMYINREKGTKRELERLQRYSNGETPSTAKIATQVWHNNRKKQKKVLLKDYEDVQVTHIIRQEKFMTELQEKKEKNKVLQEELERIRVSGITFLMLCVILNSKRRLKSLRRSSRKHLSIYCKLQCGPELYPSIDLLNNKTVLSRYHMLSLAYVDFFTWG